MKMSQDFEVENKAFIFDWSGTLIDSFSLFSRICALMFKELGKAPISDDEIRRTFTLPYMKFWNKHFPDLSKNRQDALFIECSKNSIDNNSIDNNSIDDNSIDDGSNDNAINGSNDNSIDIDSNNVSIDIDSNVNDSKLYAGVMDILLFLKNNDYKLYILSSDPIDKLFSEIDNFGIRDLFEKIIGNIHEKNIVLRSLMQTYNLSKENTYYVGDTSGDVEAGKSAGVKTIGITWGFQDRLLLEESGPDFLIDDLSEIKNIIDVVGVIK
jgi:phosphoglycolate phosphatase-like HAD superfamily hydrolase